MSKTGKPSKVDLDIQKIVGDAGTVEKVKKGRKIADIQLPTTSLDSGVFDEREALNAKADMENYGIEPEEVIETTSTTEVAAEQVIEDAAPLEEKVDQDFVPEEKAKTVAVTETQIAETIETKPRAIEEKTVPLGALHEAREMYKTERNSNKELKGEVEALKKQVSQFIERSADLSTSEVDEDFTDPRFKTLENRLNTIDSETKYSKDVDRIAKRDREIDNVDKQLESEGFPGFKKFGKDILKSQLLTMASADPVYAQANDNAAGWIKLYKETIYPDLKKTMAERQRDEVFEKKTESKKEAQLVNTVGTQTSESSSTETKPQITPYSEYLAMRDQFKA